MNNLVNVCSLQVKGDFKNSVNVWHEFITVINSLPGVMVINAISHNFPGGGFSGLILIGESHAAIHTWPELDLAWVELATCGDPKSIEMFQAYWIKKS
jgi:S-adenosylmethionine decarboxylase